tara:strand:+ start:692 stop:934 length:243 start_codon:yes stop_codon:yes gene_type:complete
MKEQELIQQILLLETEIQLLKDSKNDILQERTKLDLQLTELNRHYKEIGGEYYDTLTKEERQTLLSMATITIDAVKKHYT